MNTEFVCFSIDLFWETVNNNFMLHFLQVTFSMLEIYNEQVRDLQAQFKKHQQEGLKIRQHPKLGFYVDGLKVMICFQIFFFIILGRIFESIFPNGEFMCFCQIFQQIPVQGYSEIERLMNQGTVNRTTAATNMNETSSRSHMVITVNFKQVNYC